MSNSDYKAAYTPLDALGRDWGKLAVLRWDEDIFGFPVADYSLGDVRLVVQELESVRTALTSWAASHQVELIACGVSAADPVWIGLLPELGFRFVECSLQVTLPRLQVVALPKPRVLIRLALPEDRESVEQIGATAFRTGRYHADIRFPSRLADQRYRVWVQNAFKEMERDAQTRIYVTGEPGAATSFLHVTVRDNMADLRLGAVDPTLQGGLLGLNLYAAVMNALKESGVRQVTAKIPAGNTSVMNLYAGLGFHFSKPAVTFHWHAPHAAHLRSFSQILHQHFSKPETGDI